MGGQMGGMPPMGGMNMGGPPMGGMNMGGPPMGGMNMGGPPMGGGMGPMGGMAGQQQFGNNPFWAIISSQRN